MPLSFGSYSGCVAEAALHTSAARKLMLCGGLKARGSHIISWRQQGTLVTNPYGLNVAALPVHTNVCLPVRCHRTCSRVCAHCLYRQCAQCKASVLPA
mmetsp:Transcript_52473/g.86214  ORF Transcript_52473/g.86214 Transcript_52473/m.86214 type:complete len:98 (+) Transcript_52473:875-1168(+)